MRVKYYNALLWCSGKVSSRRLSYCRSAMTSAFSRMCNIADGRLHNIRGKGKKGNKCVSGSGVY